PRLRRRARRRGGGRARPRARLRQVLRPRLLRDGDDRGARDAWSVGRGGFRYDVEGWDGLRITAAGEAYGGEIGETSVIRSLTPPLSAVRADDTAVNGGHLRLQVEDASEPDSGWTLRAYYDRTDRDALYLEESRDTLEVAWEQHMEAADRLWFIWGATYRFTTDDTDGTLTTSFDKEDRSVHLFSGFVQGNYDLVADRLLLMFGSKVEYDDLAGLQALPGLRLAWTPTEDHTVWAAASRALRNPARTSKDLRITLGVLPTAPPSPIRAAGRNGIDPERLAAYEAGYRFRYGEAFNLDATFFYNRYDDLVEAIPSPASPALFLLRNVQSAETFGGEIALTLRPVDFWELSAAYSWSKTHLLRTTPGTTGATREPGEGSFPRNLAQAHSRMDLPGGVEFNVAAYYVDRTPIYDVPAYVRLDVGLAWRPIEAVELSLWGQNLLDDRRPEFDDELVLGVRGEVERAVWGSVALRF
ncbi:MAG: TonB-dependent receptor, partial [Candidatus Methylomirabilis sp.]|nr:TonB-dependent receptor [Deltaproteobacteria bacterium]